MNSRMSDGLLLSNDHLTNELTNCLGWVKFKLRNEYHNSFVFLVRFLLFFVNIYFAEDIFTNTEKITVSHKALLETNLTVIAYIEESKRRLEELRLKRAREASSLKEVVKILSK